MKDTTELSKEIKQFFESTDNNFEGATIKVNFSGNNCTVSISKMYHGLGNLISFANLNWLSKKLGTEEINLINEYYREGCETCDYGSEHSVDIECLNIKI